MTASKDNAVVWLSAPWAAGIRGFAEQHPPQLVAGQRACRQNLAHYVPSS